MAVVRGAVVHSEAVAEAVHGVEVSAAEVVPEAGVSAAVEAEVSAEVRGEAAAFGLEQPLGQAAPPGPAAHSVRGGPADRPELAPVHGSGDVRQRRVFDGPRGKLLPAVRPPVVRPPAVRSSTATRQPIVSSIAVAEYAAATAGRSHRSSIAGIARDHHSRTAAEPVPVSAEETAAVL